MIYVFLAEGFEEVEAVTPIDFLRRCSLDVKLLGVGTKNVCGSHGISIICDSVADEAVFNDKLEMIILPGGMPGTVNLEKSPIVQKAIDYCSDNSIYIAAICAAPSILGHHGLLNGYEAICFPGIEKELTGATISKKCAVADRKIITGKSAGAAIEFSLLLIEKLISKERAEKLKESLKCE